MSAKGHARHRAAKVPEGLDVFARLGLVDAVGVQWRARERERRRKRKRAKVELNAK